MKSPFSHGFPMVLPWFSYGNHRGIHFLGAAGLAARGLHQATAASRQRRQGCGRGRFLFGKHGNERGKMAMRYSFFIGFHGISWVLYGFPWDFHGF